MPGHGEGEAGLAGGDALDPGDYEGAPVEDDRQRRQPGLVVVLGTEVTEDWVGQVALQQFGGPQLPVPQERHSRLAVLGAAPPEQLAGRRRRTRPLIEHREPDLPAGERLVEHRQVGDDEGQEGEARTGFDDGDRPGKGVRGCDVAEAQGEEGAGAHVEQGGKAAGARGACPASAQLQQREAEYHAGRPDRHQEQQRERAVEAEVVLSPLCAPEHARRP